MTDTTPFKISPSARFPNAVLRIPTALATKNRFIRKRQTPIWIVTETEKAFLIKFEDGTETYWIPKGSSRLIQKKE